MRVSGCQRMGEGSYPLTEAGSFWGDENAVKPDKGGRLHSMAKAPNATELCALKQSVRYVNFTSILKTPTDETLGVLSLTGPPVAPAPGPPPLALRGPSTCPEAGQSHRLQGSEAAEDKCH